MLAKTKYVQVQTMTSNLLIIICNLAHNLPQYFYELVLPYHFLNVTQYDNAKKISVVSTVRNEKKKNSSPLQFSLVGKGMYSIQWAAK